MRKARESEPVEYNSPLKNVEDMWAVYRFIFPSLGRKPLDLNLNVPFCPLLGTVVKQKSSRSVTGLINKNVIISRALKRQIRGTGG
jgi:hypothetical protein